MAATERITMMMRELDRPKVIQAVVDTGLKRARCSADQSRALNVFLPGSFKPLMPATIHPRHPR
ncbi:hypothetical protein D5R55_21635 [Burkholderia cenocepacia]|uniref:Uncharacterized protein n=1 Tax=Burkholderia cenocepacia TaxID=95486 RepID=A0A3Q9FBJ1_9BURK|nr:hypothetical protein D5R55_21635 [Burkholderia cenocepacia]